MSYWDFFGVFQCQPEITYFSMNLLSKRPIFRYFWSNKFRSGFSKLKRWDEIRFQNKHNVPFRANIEIIRFGYILRIFQETESVYVILKCKLQQIFFRWIIRRFVVSEFVNLLIWWIWYKKDRLTKYESLKLILKFDASDLFLL